MDAVAQAVPGVDKMTTTQSELERVLAALDDEHVRLPNERRDAARLLREMARDFKHWAHCASACSMVPRGLCTCGLDAARIKWRLP